MDESGSDITMSKAPGWFSQARKKGQAWEVQFWEAWEFVPKGAWPDRTMVPVLLPLHDAPTPTHDGRDDTYDNDPGSGFGGKDTAGFISIHGEYGLIQGRISRVDFGIGRVPPSAETWSTWVDPQITLPNGKNSNHDLKVAWCDY
jgi:hypothetical protein